MRGGNLGVTQRARVEFARSSGSINTDAIDNAGGVDCSDHEVNIKIALNLAVFPSVLHEQWGAAIRRHRLRREIIANRLANLVVDRAGTTMVYRVSQETSAAAAEIVAAHMAAWTIFELDELTEAVNAMDGTLPALTQLGIHLSARQLAERAARQLIRTRPYPFSAAQALADLTTPVHQIVGRMPQYLVGADLAAYEAQLTDLLETGLPHKLAERVAAMALSLSAIEIVEVARERGVEPTIVAAVHFEMADRLELNWLRGRILGLPRDSQWSSLARLTLRADLYADHRALTAQAVGQGHDPDPHELVERWLQENASAAGHYRRTISDIRAAGPTDITTLLVGAREVRNLIDRTTPIAGTST